MENKQYSYELPKTWYNKWIKALKSGNYEQMDSLLYHDEYGAYCALGLAYHVCGNVDKKLLHDSGEINKDILKRYNQNNNKKYYYIPTELLSPSGLADEIVEMNDSGWSFSDIAEWIEDEVLPYEDKK